MKIKKRRTNWYWIYLEKDNSENYENAIDFRWSDVKGKDKDDVAKANFIESLQK